MEGGERRGFSSAWEEWLKSPRRSLEEVEGKAQRRERQRVYWLERMEAFAGREVKWEVRIRSCEGDGGSAGG